MRAVLFFVGSCLQLMLLAASPAASEPGSFQLLDVDATYVCTPVPAGAGTRPGSSVPMAWRTATRTSEPADAEYGPEKIHEIHRLEASARTDEEAMAIKQTGMKFVRNLSDFQLLVRHPPGLPSSTYMRLRRGFIVRNVGQVAAAERARGQVGYEPIQQILDLEIMAETPSEAMAIKTAGLTFVRDRRDFKQLSRWTDNPSIQYLIARSRFVTRHGERWQ